ncbi:unnamed protein product [Rotaria sp. Silwood1]|nr:unnamed protein product [Rotaria sp. Silwood1]CAF1206197.1 unnamed protein product [Rotaria sp. Silwood1]CAF3738600.1 unnamed protein product [Rotaria sp. Silwood1]CAF4909053.1 unnamed protein product [Rotaria sp. Silwood1]
MEQNDGNNYDSDLDDEKTGQIDEYIPIRLTFDEKLAAHRSNRLNQTFGQINVPYDSQSKVEKEISDETLVPLRCKISHNTTRVQIYEKSCQTLDITSDWQIRDLLSYDNITIIDRSFSFNDFRAFATAIEANLESLTLNSVGLTSRSVHVLCQALNSCVHLNLLDLSNNKIGKKGFESIVDTLNYLPSLLYLSLAKCGIEDSYGTRIGDLCRPKKLLELNLSGNEFEENACIFIGHALTENTNLLHLNLSWNLIRGVAPVSLFRGIEVNQSLTELDLSWNGLSYDGSVALRRVLIVNKVLQRLNINNCNIEWISAKLISEGLMKNSTLHYLNLAYNPITTHGVQYLIQALNVKTSAVSILDISGITVYTSTVRLAEKIAQQRDFIMKYDCEMPVHDMLGRETVTKGDSMRKVIQYIDERRWRTLEYFRMLDKNNTLQLERKTVTLNIVKSGVQLERADIQNIHQRFTRDAVQPLTYKNINTIFNQQRMRDRSLKARQEKQAKDMRKHNRKILQTVSHHFPDIDIMTRYQKHQETVERLARPRTYSACPKA